jgi:hypothetical protein
MLGTGFPDALHSRVIDPPLRAFNWPLDGDIRILGGTETEAEIDMFSSFMHYWIQKMRKIKLENLAYIFILESQGNDNEE